MTSKHVFPCDLRLYSALVTRLSYSMLIDPADASPKLSADPTEFLFNLEENYYTIQR